ncbi:MAG: DUF4136 domain-containing protein [Nitrospira sp.]
MKRTYGRLTLCAALLACMGCAQTVTVNVFGTSQSPDPIPRDVTYSVMPTNEVEKDPAFLEYAKLVSHKMDARGYKKTSDKTAHLGVYLAYGSTATATPTGAPVPPMGVGGGMSSAGSGTGSYGMATRTPSETTSVRQYKNQLVIVVLDLQRSRGAGSAVELWRGETMNTSSSNDLTQLAPLMVDAAFRHFGETTPRSVPHHFTDEESKKIRDSQ